MNGYTTSSMPPVTVASIKAAMRQAMALTPPPHEQVVGFRVGRADMEELKRRADAMPLSVGGEISISGTPISVDPILEPGQWLSDRADGSTHIHRNGQEIRVPAWDDLQEKFSAPDHNQP